MRALCLLLLCAAFPRALAQGAPPSPYVARGACPFECCRYGEWTAAEPVAVYASEREPGEASFTLAPREPFEAVTGNVYVDSIGVVVVVRAGEAYGEGRAVPLAPGDTLHVLDYLGEGFYHVWHGGALLQAEAWWAEPEAPVGGDGPFGVLLREPWMEWWVQVRARDGREGWIRMSEASVEGADGCG